MMVRLECQNLSAYPRPHEAASDGGGGIGEGARDDEFMNPVGIGEVAAECVEPGLDVEL